MTDKTTKTYRLPNDLLKELDIAAKATMRSQSNMLTLILKEWVERQKIKTPLDISE